LLLVRNEHFDYRLLTSQKQRVCQASRRRAVADGASSVVAVVGRDEVRRRNI
jgi:hypothetical protein